MKHLKKASLIGVSVLALIFTSCGKPGKDEYTPPVDPPPTPTINYPSMTVTPSTTKTAYGDSIVITLASQYASDIKMDGVPLGKTSGTVTVKNIVGPIEKIFETVNSDPKATVPVTKTLPLSSYSKEETDLSNGLYYILTIDRGRMHGDTTHWYYHTPPCRNWQFFLGGNMTIVNSACTSPSTNAPATYSLANNMLNISAQTGVQGQIQKVTKDTLILLYANPVKDPSGLIIGYDSTQRTWIKTH